MYSTCRYAIAVPFLLLLLILTGFAGTAHSASDAFADVNSDIIQSESVSFEDVIPADGIFLQTKTQTSRQLDQSSFLIMPKADYSDRRQLALLDKYSFRKSSQAPDPVLSWETGEGKSYLIPALETPGFVLALNIFDRLVFPDKIKEGKKAYRTTPSTIWEHLRRQNWRFDRDSFDVNQFGHPYEGATFYGLARSSGLNFWQSLIYSHAGSFLWEMAGETTRPSINDMITTGNAGSFLGEALFRMAELVLEDGGSKPDGRHELAAAIVSPSTGFNRWAFGNRFKSQFPNHDPATFWQLMVGANLDTHSSDLSPEASEYNANVIADFTMAYGLPGKRGYTYTRPLDYFDFQLALRARLGNPLEALTLRGLLIGTDYQKGSDYRGIWGLYGSYDYVSPHLYRVSSTALSLGTTGQYWLAPGIALQGSLLGGVGFGAAGTDTIETDGRGYHYGAIPQVLLALNFLFGDRTVFEVAGRGYYVHGSDLDQYVMRANTGITIRVSGNHAVSVRFVESTRDTKYQDRPTKHNSEGTVSVVYTFVSDTRFGAVEWRDYSEQ